MDHGYCGTLLGIPRSVTCFLPNDVLSSLVIESFGDGIGTHQDGNGASKDTCGVGDRMHSLSAYPW